MAAVSPLEELKRLGGNLENSPFACCGAVEPTPRGAHAKGVAVYYKDAEGQVCELPFPPRDARDIESLIQVGAPAPIGRSPEDVLDPLCRQAVELERDQFTTSIDLGEFSIVDELHAMMGDGTTGVRAVLRKLNIYGPGGFFKEPRDTARSSQCVGTLVLFLPTAFTGGELVVKNADGSTLHTFALGTEAASGKLQWCAFFYDCEHEVLPVRDGYRVTLTYDLAHQTPQHPMQLDAQPFTAFSEQLAALLQDPTFAPDGLKLGFGLLHEYVIHQRKDYSYRRTDGPKETAEDKIFPQLKGADCVLKATLDRLGLQYALVPVYASDGYSASTPSIAREGEEEDYGQYLNRQLVPTPAEWNFPFPTEGDPQGAWRGDSEKLLFISGWGTYNADDRFGMVVNGPGGLAYRPLALRKARDVVWLVRPANCPYVKTRVTCDAEYSQYYVAACLVVYVPPSTTRIQ